jgi:hypothetical protein
LLLLAMCCYCSTTHSCTHFNPHFCCPL